MKKYYSQALYRVYLLLVSTTLFSSCASKLTDLPFNQMGAVERVDNLSDDNYWEFNPSFSGDGKMVVFARSEVNFSNTHICVSEKKGENWTFPKLISFSDSAYVDSDPTFSVDGNYLYFISDRPAPGKTGKDLDIWRVRKNTSSWDEPEWLGPNINSPDMELGPMVLENKIYFGSSRPNGVGALDIYQADLDAAKESRPILFRDSINSPSMEGDIEFFAKGKQIVFWSNRKGGKGRGDIYWSQLIKKTKKWSTPESLKGAINSENHEFTPTISGDGKWIYFARMIRTGTSQTCDIYRFKIR